MFARLVLASGLLTCLILFDPVPAGADDTRVIIGAPGVRIDTPPLSIQIGPPAYYPPHYHYPAPRYYYPAPRYYGPRYYYPAPRHYHGPRYYPRHHHQRPYGRPYHRDHYRHDHRR